MADRTVRVRVIAEMPGFGTVVRTGTGELLALGEASSSRAAGFVPSVRMERQPAPA